MRRRYESRLGMLEATALDETQLLRFVLLWIRGEDVPGLNREDAELVLEYAEFAMRAPEGLPARPELTTATELRAAVDLGSGRYFLGGRVPDLPQAWQPLAALTAASRERLGPSDQTDPLFA